MAIMCESYPTRTRTYSFSSGIDLELTIDPDFPIPYGM